MSWVLPIIRSSGYWLFNNFPQRLTFRESFILLLEIRKFPKTDFQKSIFGVVKAPLSWLQTLCLIFEVFENPRHTRFSWKHLGFDVFSILSLISKSLSQDYLRKLLAQNIWLVSWEGTAKLVAIAHRIRCVNDLCIICRIYLRINVIHP